MRHRSARYVLIGTVLASGIWFLTTALPVMEVVTGLAESARATGATGVVLFFAGYVLGTIFVIPGSPQSIASRAEDSGV